MQKQNTDAEQCFLKQKEEDVINTATGGFKVQLNCPCSSNRVEDDLLVTGS